MKEAGAVPLDQEVKELLTRTCIAPYPSPVSAFPRSSGRRAVGSGLVIPASVEAWRAVAA